MEEIKQITLPTPAISSGPNTDTVPSFPNLDEILQQRRQYREALRAASAPTSLPYAPAFSASTARFNLLPPFLSGSSSSHLVLNHLSGQEHRKSTSVDPSNRNSSRKRGSEQSQDEHEVLELLAAALDETDISQSDPTVFSRLLLPNSTSRSSFGDAGGVGDFIRHASEPAAAQLLRFRSLQQNLEYGLGSRVAGEASLSGRQVRKSAKQVIEYDDDMKIDYDLDAESMETDENQEGGDADEDVFNIPAYPFSDHNPTEENKARRRARKGEKADKRDAKKNDHPYDDCLCLAGVQTHELNLTRSEPVHSTHRLMTIAESPAYHQVKDFNLLPHLRLRVRRDAHIRLDHRHLDDDEADDEADLESLKREDYITIRLVCEEANPRRPKCPIFLAAVPVLYKRNDTEDIVLTSLKVTQSMLPGRTKGYKFYLLATLIHNDQQVDFVLSHPFLLWSNVNQDGFPREDRANFLKARIEMNKKRRGKGDSDSENEGEPFSEEPAKPTFQKLKSTPQRTKVIRKTDKDKDYKPDMEPRTKRSKLEVIWKTTVQRSC
eukprot:TRINITY_DN2349_c0_g1_i2.p1 TRINITY_DN2349_c0_g1~~TRINITY_DN2349_c0_g1_i2.p1  ORF type:complete len:549 (-),score=102.00 TRINITY_DN2349_c0_g1_i2:34-1680(-)